MINRVINVPRRREANSVFDYLIGVYRLTNYQPKEAALEQRIFLLDGHGLRGMDISDMIENEFVERMGLIRDEERDAASGYLMDEFFKYHEKAAEYIQGLEHLGPNSPEKDMFMKKAFEQVCKATKYLSILMRIDPDSKLFEGKLENGYETLTEGMKVLRRILYAHNLKDHLVK